jgi:hypothetical protein
MDVKSSTLWIHEVRMEVVIMAMKNEYVVDPCERDQRYKNIISGFLS